MSRQCARQGCVHPATVTLSYQYARSLVWLDNLSAERDPHCYDLCEQHAGRLTAPSGWHLEDRRQRIHVYAPHASDSVREATGVVPDHAPEHALAERGENRLAG